MKYLCLISSGWISTTFIIDDVMFAHGSYKHRPLLKYDQFFVATLGPWLQFCFEILQFLLMYNSTLGSNSLISICFLGSSRFCCCFLSITAVYSITDPRDLQQPTLMCLEKLTVKSPYGVNVCDNDFIYWDVIKKLSVRETLLNLQILV